MSRLLFFFSFVVPPLIKREGLRFFITGVPLLHLIPPEVNTFSQNTNYSKFYCIQGHLSMQDSGAAYASAYLNLRNAS
jgi:hypothetical protein